MAQPGSASGLGPEGRRFESCPPDQQNQLVDRISVFSFGSFILRDKGERIGRNPKTGVEVPIAPRRVLTFRASQLLRDQIAKAD